MTHQSRFKSAERKLVLIHMDKYTVVKRVPRTTISIRMHLKMIDSFRCEASKQEVKLGNLLTQILEKYYRDHLKDEDSTH